ncbi:MAG: HIT family protein [archaeon]
MTDCDICNILASKESFKFIYEDEFCFAVLHESPSVPGHSLVIPKKHSPILEELDDKIVEHLFLAANKVSTAIFEVLGSHGTNILVNNGIDAGQELPHVVVNVIPRKDKDGLNLEWLPKKAGDSELKSIKNRLQAYSDAIYLGKDKLPDIKVIDDFKQAEHSSSVHNTNEPKEKTEDYLVKSLRRMP